jgi:hypothetical protein
MTHPREAHVQALTNIVKELMIGTVIPLISVPHDAVFTLSLASKQRFCRADDGKIYSLGAAWEIQEDGEEGWEIKTTPESNKAFCLIEISEPESARVLVMDFMNEPPLEKYSQSPGVSS